MAHRISITLRFFVYFLVVFGLAALHWIGRKFGEPSIDQLLYHAFEAGTLALTADEALVGSFIKNVLVVPLFASGLITWADSTLNRRIKTRLAGDKTIPRFAWNWRMPALLTATAFFLMSEVSAFTYISDQTQNSGYFSEQYLPIGASEIVPRNPKNLVLIYMESIEASYSDATLFGRDLLHPLNALPGVSFGNFQQVPGTSWTVAGMVGTQCGVPLKNIFSAKIREENETNHEMNNFGNLFAHFLPGAVCLGDILQQHGYRNVFIGGASLSFAGKGRFMRDHGYDELYGREELVADGMTNELNTWGFYDDAVFGFARTKIEELYRTGRPFNLTLLTIDTHGPNGFVSPTCAARGVENFTGIVSCSAEQTAAFVGFLDKAGYLADTRVVILGDHVTMRNPLSERLEHAPQRTVFNRFVGTDLPRPNREAIVHFDLLPSILEVVGLPIGGGRLGLGYSGFGELAVPPGVDRLAHLREHLPKRSAAYSALWHTTPVGAPPVH